MVLRAQPDKSETIKTIAYELRRVAMLYQIPNWTDQNSVLLAEWIFDSYNCEPLELIVKTLRNPPEIKDDYGRSVTSWRLTPETITQWMKHSLSLRSEVIEKENQLLKPESKEELPGIDYNSFKSRLINQNGVNVLPENKNLPWYKQPEYLEYKNKLLHKKACNTRSGSDNKSQDTNDNL